MLENCVLPLLYHIDEFDKGIDFIIIPSLSLTTDLSTTPLPQVFFYYVFDASQMTKIRKIILVSILYFDIKLEIITPSRNPRS